MKMIWFLELVMEFSFSCYPYAGKRNLKITKRSQCHHLIIMYFLDENYIEREGAYKRGVLIREGMLIRVGVIIREVCF